MYLRSIGLAISLAFVCAVSGYAKPLELPPLVLKQTAHQHLQAPLTGRFTVLPDKDFNAKIVGPQSTTGATIPMWSRSLSSGYTYHMVGRNPYVALSTQTTNITAVVIPIVFKFTSAGNIVFDPTVATGCLGGKNATSLTAGSPLFNPVVGYPGGTYIGTGEYVDLFQRANYWSQTNPGGINPDYHVNLVHKQVAKIVVPVTGGEVDTVTCGYLGLIDINTWDTYVQNTLMPYLASQSPKIAPPTTLPIFLFTNVVMYQGSTSNCCILGYHSAFSDPSYGGAFHTYANGEYDSSQAFGPTVSDTSVLSHEIAEWMDDPSGSNPTPSWGNIGQVAGCQSNLEVGDPLSGTLSQIYMPGNQRTYHVQDLAFTSWFYHQKPSTGVNGWYSLMGTFLTYAAPC